MLDTLVGFVEVLHRIRVGVVDGFRSASQQDGEDGQARGFRDLLDHLGSLTRNTIAVTVAGHTERFEQLTVPTRTQQRAFEFLDTPVPLELT